MRHFFVCRWNGKMYQLGFINNIWQNKIHVLDFVSICKVLRNRTSKLRHFYQINGNFFAFFFLQEIIQNDAIIYLSRLKCISLWIEILLIFWLYWNFLKFLPNDRPLLLYLKKYLDGFFNRISQKKYSTTLVHKIRRKNHFIHFPWMSH